MYKRQIGVGALEYPAEWQGASNETLNRNAVSKILTLTSTYDHRIIQGAQSGEFLRVIHQLLLGDDALLVIRVAIEGFSQAEIAVELGLTEAAARKRYQRAMRRLHDALTEIP